LSGFWAPPWFSVNNFLKRNDKNTGNKIHGLMGNTNIKYGIIYYNKE
jgi:hypothetical protein